MVDELVRTRMVYSETAFADMVLWKVPEALAGSTHRFTCRLAYAVEGDCVLRYDTEAGKGEHRHYGDNESVYPFSTPEGLIADFRRDIEEVES